MDIITKLKDFLINLYSKKPFRLLFAVIFLAFVLKNYSSVPNNIKKNDGLSNIFSINKIKDKIETETFLRQKRQEELKQQAILSKNNDKPTSIRESVNKVLDNLPTTISPQESRVSTQITKKLTNTKQNNSRTIANEGTLVIAEMIIFNGNTNNIINKIEEMPILINNDKQNVFAKYVKNKKVGFSTIIPMTEIMPTSKEVPPVNIAYKITIKSIRSAENTKK